MKTRFVYNFTGAIILAIALFFPSMVESAAKINIDDTRWISIGGGLRTSFSATENAAPSGDSYSKGFNLDNQRIYFNGQLHKSIYIEFNTELDANDDLRILDALGKFEFSNLLKIWGGFFLVPGDRSILDGPFYLNAYEYPFVSNYPGEFAGRDTGLAVWGETGSGNFKYQVGAFQGRRSDSDLGVNPNQDDNLLYAGRLTYNFWEPEPGYYTSSIYYGAKDVLALGLAGQYQKNGAGTATSPGNFTGWHLDFLLEKTLGKYGVVNLEAAYYNYDLDNVPDANLVEGNSFFVLASYLFPTKVGWGRFEPLFRYQRFDRDQSNMLGQRGIRDQFTGQLNYIIDGHNARLSAYWARQDPGPTEQTQNTFFIGFQLQI